MRIPYAHLCDHALVSRDGKLSVLGIFSRVNAPTMPFALPVAHIAFEVEINHAEVNREFEIVIEMIDADGNKIFRAESKTAIRGAAKFGDKPSAGFAIAVIGLTFKREGPHNLNFWLNGKLEHQLDLQVMLVPPTPARPELELG